MATLIWDKVGERIYQAGVDRGVLYLHDGTAVPWNGLKDIEESSNPELQSFYLDGVKYLQNFTPGDYLGKLKAFTYPEEFESVNGIAKLTPGLSFYDQPAKSFNLSYRTRIGNDVDGGEHGYKIHILYNVIANPDPYSFETSTDSGLQPIEFGWSLSGTPEKIHGFKPTVHVSIDSTKTPPDVMSLIENILYGTDTNNPSLPSITNIAEFFGYLGALVIVDYGDGTWGAIDQSDTYITMIDSTTFKIDNADTIFLDASTYQLSSTNVGDES